MTKVIFQETQRFRQIWIWAILLGVTGISLGSIFFMERDIKSYLVDADTRMINLLKNGVNLVPFTENNGQIGVVILLKKRMPIGQPVRYLLTININQMKNGAWLF